jgi:predicted small secreted protein
MKKINFFCCLALLGLLALPACSNTVDGLGQDVEKAGRNIQDTVK